MIQYMTSDGTFMPGDPDQVAAQVAAQAAASAAQAAQSGARTTILIVVGIGAYLWYSHKKKRKAVTGDGGGGK